MNWTHVLWLVLCGSVVILGDDGFLESESKETVSRLERDLERENFILYKERILQEEPTPGACEENKDCKNGGTCEGKVCKCPEGTSGDCSIVDACSGLKEVCESIDALCVYDSTADDKANCKCNKANFLFDGKTCAEKCGDVVCKYGALCKTDVCDCPEGTKERDCGVVEGCTDLQDVCDKSNADCIYDPKAEKKATCQCKEENYKFDGTSCLECNCGQFGNCSFNDGGNKECACNKKYIEKEGTCVECDCGTVGVDKCEFNGTEKVCTCSQNYVLKEGVCAECDCGTVGVDKCEFNGTEKVCTCSQNYVLKEGVCAECDCGTAGVDKCEFNGTDKLCTCSQNFAFKEGVCAECDCGSNGKCTFNKDDEKICNCQDKFAVMNDTCIECDCGSNGKCTFDEDDEKTCDCQDKFAVMNDTCIACDCGEGSCSFNNDGKKVCNCKPKFAVKGDDTCAACDCGVQSDSCNFNGDVIVCSCKEKHSQKDEVCAECDCGEGTCSFVGGQKTCACKENFAVKDGKCEECNCGDNQVKTNGCKFSNGQQVCNCKIKYAQKDKTCVACDCGDKEISCKFTEDKQVCECQAKYAQMDNTCKECDCGTQGTCTFDEDEEKVCECNEKFAVKNGTCVGCDCGKFGVCSYSGEDKKCACNNTYVELDGRCRKCDCGTKGTCSFDKDKKKQCACETDYAVRDGTCHETCDPDDSECDHDTKCEGSKEKNFFCNCRGIFSGDKCEKIVDCEIGDYKDCESSGGKCTYTTENTTLCTCDGDKLLDPKSKKCRTKCDFTKNDCKNGAECEKELCDCPKGTDGDDCSVVIGCDKTLKEECETAGAGCVFDASTTNLASCQCNDKKNFYYENKKCLPIFCKENPCKLEVSNCTFSNGAGSCVCLKEGEYYDYGQNTCVGLKKCPLEPCEENKQCKKGKCVCDDNYVPENGTCIRKKLCIGKSKPCYEGAECEEGDVVGTVKCACPSDSFYNPKTRKCEDGKCFLLSERKNCTDACPSPKLKRAEDGNCVAKVDAEKCDKDCGDYGYCLKEGEKETCVCIKKFGVLKDGKCILNAENVCITKGTQEGNPMKCKCFNIFKYSKNGISCEWESCGDDHAQEDCILKGAFCTDNKANLTRPYSCKCTGGKVTNKRCIDICSDEDTIKECSIKQQVCYKNAKGEGTCVCPPGFSEKVMTSDVDKTQKKTTCEPDAKYAYLLQNLPVISKKYMKEDKSVDEVKLTSFIIQSMTTIYPKLKYSYLHQYRTSEDKEVLFSDVWLQFEQDATSYIKRWKSELVAQDDESLVLPPALQLRTNKIEEANDSPLTFCSDIVWKSACGLGARCEDNKCSCKEGFKIIGPTVQEYGETTVLRCNDIDECLEGKHNCTSNSKCVNTMGSYICKCTPGYHKKDTSLGDESQGECIELCSPNPCANDGECKVNKEYNVECSCKVGFKGSFCGEEDTKLKKAQHSTTVVGAVLGTLLAVTFVTIIVYILWKRKNSYSEDFAPSPRDNAEMVERNRPLRGVSNRGYQ